MRFGLTWNSTISRVSPNRMRVRGAVCTKASITMKKGKAHKNHAAPMILAAPMLAPPIHIERNCSETGSDCKLKAT